MKNETDVINIRIDSDVKNELEKIAKSEQRTLAGQIRLALSEWLKAKSVRPGPLRKRLITEDKYMQANHLYGISQ